MDILGTAITLATVKGEKRLKFKVFTEHGSIQVVSPRMELQGGLEVADSLEDMAKRIRVAMDSVQKA